MDIKKIQPQTNPESINPSGALGKKDSLAGPSFGETLQKVGATPAPETTIAISAKNIDPVKFSNHALERMVHRGIKFSPQELGRLNDAVQRAQSKGSKNSLILMNDNALIVSVKNNTVVTVVDKNSLKENVFTNIDSTIVM